MVMRILPQVIQDPQRSQAGQVNGNVTPLRDATGQQAAALGDAMQQAGQAVTSVADRYQDNIDIAKSAQAENRLRDVMRVHLEEPETGFLTTVGSQASEERRKQSFDQIERSRRDIEKGLDNEAQKANFRDQSTRMLGTASSLAARHRDRESSNFMAGQLKARSMNSIDEATKLAGTDAGEVAKLSALDDIEEWGRATGISDEEIRAAKMQATTSLHETVVRGLGKNGVASVAAQYLEANSAEISADRLADLRDYTRRAGETEASAAVSDAAQRQAVAEMSDRWRKDGTKHRKLDIEESWQRASEIVRRNDKLPIGVRDKALDRIEADYKQTKLNEARRGNAVAEQATKWLLDNPFAGPDGLPDDLAQAVDTAGVREEVNAFANSNRRYVSDPATSAGLWMMSDEKLRSIPPELLWRQYRGKLDNQDLETLMARQRRSMGASSKNDEVAITRAERIKDSYYELAKQKRGQELSPEKAKEFVEFKKRVQQRINYEPQDREITAERLQQILDEVALDKVVDVDGWDTLRPSILVSDASRAEGAYVTVYGKEERLDQIREEIRREIALALVAEGQPVSEQRIMQEWIDGGRQR